MPEHSDNNESQLPTSTNSEKSKCSICCAEGDGYHFGAESCRACAAFFRRSVSTKKKYICRGAGNCETTTDVRCMCRACRFAKCVKVGMSPAGVQRPRDAHGKRLRHAKDEHTFPNPRPIDQVLKEASTAISSSSSTTPNVENMPILEKMRQNYMKMVQNRTILHRREGDSMFKPKVPKSLTYKESALVIEKEVSMVIDWVSFCFEEFEALPGEQKRVLFRSFLMNFTLLQNSYLCHINDREDVIIMASGDYIDLKNLQTFYHDEETPDTPHTMSSEEAVKLFQQSFEIMRQSLTLPMMQEKIDVYEFFTLCTCALWDFGLDGQSSECIQIGKSVKTKVFRELLFYLTNIRKVEEPPIRIAWLLTLLPGVNRTVKKFQEDIEISHVFNIFPVPNQFYNIMNGKFL